VTLSIQSAAAIAWQCIIAPKDKSGRSRAPHKLRNSLVAQSSRKKPLHRERFRPPRI
jgi:hypothetical protein